MAQDTPAASDPEEDSHLLTSQLDFPVVGLGASASFSSSLASGIAPGIRSPSAKKIVGVPLMANFRPISTLFFTAVVSQSPLPPGALPSTIQSFHALTLSAEHQI